MTTRSLLRSCMCIAETPMLERRRLHLPPPAAAAAGRWENEISTRKQPISITIVFYERNVVCLSVELSKEE